MVVGDGNGDGIKDSEQSQVTSLNLRQTDRVSSNPQAPQTPVTLVVGSQDGKVSPSAGNAKITSIGQKDAPADLPEGLSTPLGLLSFTAKADTAGATETFSLYLDGALDIDGYYKQDASGTRVNLASAANGGRVVTEHGKTRLDFVIQDGGQFDLDGKADGVITDPGAPGKMALVPPPVDSDHDQFPDALEAVHGLSVGVKDNDVFGNPKLYAMQLYRDTLFREAEGAGLTYWQEVLGSGAQSRAEVANAFLGSSEFQTHTGALARLYFAAFERIPDEAGMTYWMEQLLHRSQSLEQVAQGFADSSEFQRQYGALDNAGFLDTLYQNVLGRLPDAPGKAYWLGQLAGGTTRGEALAGFAQSSEYQELMREEVSVTLFYVGLLGRTPDQSGYEHWLHVLNNQGDVLGAIDAFVQSQEYHDRFLPSDGGPAGLVGLAPMPVPDALG